MKRLPILSVLILAFLVSFLASCRHESVLSEDAPTVCFEDQVLPIIRSNCAISGCHDAGSGEGPTLTNFENISQYVEPGKPTKSELFKVITATSLFVEFMPPSTREALPQNQIDLINIWILQGAQNNSCLLIPCDTVEVNYSAEISPIINTYCKGCHSGGNPSGNISLENYDQIHAVALSGKLYGSVSFSNGYVAMPYQGNMLPDCYVAMIKKWVDNGAPNN
jgi:hypothetical protein